MYATTALQGLKFQVTYVLDVAISNPSAPGEDILVFSHEGTLGEMAHLIGSAKHPGKVLVTRKVRLVESGLTAGTERLNPQTVGALLDPSRLHEAVEDDAQAVGQWSKIIDSFDWAAA